MNLEFLEGRLPRKAVAHVRSTLSVVEYETVTASAHNILFTQTFSNRAMTFNRTLDWNHPYDRAVLRAEGKRLNAEPMRVRDLHKLARAYSDNQPHPMVHLTDDDGISVVVMRGVAAECGYGRGSARKPANQRAARRYARGEVKS